MGFEEYTDAAVELLARTALALAEVRAAHMLISGTLLGHVRHGGFIPWDDDIDLLAVGRDVLGRLPAMKKNHPELTFICADYFTYVKVYMKEKSVPTTLPKFDHCAGEEVEGRWPFVDIFLCEKRSAYLKFFHRDWQTRRFFPPQPAAFMGVPVAVPKDPHYFLSRNYGRDYMTTLWDAGYSHRLEAQVRPGGPRAV